MDRAVELDTASQRLERTAGKLARSVLRRGSGSNATLLSDLLRRMAYGEFFVVLLFLHFYVCRA